MDERAGSCSAGVQALIENDGERYGTDHVGQFNVEIVDAAGETLQESRRRRKPDREGLRRFGLKAAVAPELRRTLSGGALHDRVRGSPVAELRSRDAGSLALLQRR